MGFGMTVVLPAEDEETFVRTDPVVSMHDSDDGSMSFLVGVIEDHRIANCPYLRWVSSPENPGEDDLSDCYDPAEILEQLDELEQALVKHGSSPPLMTMFHWTRTDGRPWGCSFVTGTLNGQECTLSGGWEEARIHFPQQKRGEPLTADRITLDSNREGTPDIEVRRKTLVDTYRPVIAKIRSVCQHAVSINGLVYCETWY